MSSDNINFYNWYLLTPTSGVNNVFNSTTRYTTASIDINGWGYIRLTNPHSTTDLLNVNCTIVGNNR